MFFALKELKIFILVGKLGATKMNEVKIHVIDEIYFVRES